MIATLLQNWKSAFRETLESALAAGTAWWLGLLVFGGDHTPLFAAVTAVVCLAPGLPSHSKQAFGLFVGVIAGIAIGELALAVAGGAHPVVLGVAVFLSMMAALAFKVQPIVGIQAGVSTVIVLVEGQDVDSYARIVDALIGGTVALSFSQMLLTPDPFAIMRREGAKLVQAFDGLAQGLVQVPGRRCQSRGRGRCGARHAVCRHVPGRQSGICRAGCKANPARALAKERDREASRAMAQVLPSPATCSG